MRYRLESILVNKDNITIRGFACGKKPEAKLFLYAQDSNGHHLPIGVTLVRRNDVSVKYFKKELNNDFGFECSLPNIIKQGLYLFIQAGKDSIKLHITDLLIARWTAEMKVRNNPVLQNTKKRIEQFFRGEESYNRWYSSHKTSEADLEMQRNMTIKNDMPLFSIVIPLYKTPKIYFEALMNSISRQTYSKFEVLLADGSPNKQDIGELAIQYTNGDKRIKYRFIGENKGISGNTNEALYMAEGDYVVLCDHDDLLTEDALYELAKAIIEQPQCDCIYSDEDKVSSDGKIYFDPHFKPDFSFDYLLSVNYICHLFAFRRDMLNAVGMFDEKYDGAQDHEFILRITGKSNKIVHIPKILYHWRTHGNSTANNAESKTYAFDAGKRTIEAAYHRELADIQISSVIDGAALGIYHPVFVFQTKPLISVLIPNKDHVEDLKKAINSLFEKNNWQDYEIVIVENNSEEKETFDYYEELQRRYPFIKVVTYKGNFNYSAINNYGVKHCAGEYILFLNNDIELIENSSLEEMLGYAQRKDVGAVGCRLLYPDGSIQHAGIVIGIGVADHVFKNTYPNDGTYFNKAMVTQNYSAVTAAAMMTRKSVFEEVGGFDEKLAVAFNDVDYCLRLRERGYSIVYTPYACFYHYESKSRGHDTTSEKNARYMQELTLFTSRWRKYYEKGDPYYNPNLTVEKTDYSLKK